MVKRLFDSVDVIAKTKKVDEKKYSLSDGEYDYGCNSTSDI